jgi:hypothetical protein
LINFKNGPSLVAEIFAIFISLEIVTPQEFPTYFPEHSFQMIERFFDRVQKENLKEKLIESSFWKEKHWKKSEFSPFRTLQIIPVDLIEIWTDYHYHFVVQENIEDPIKISQIAENEFPDEMKSSQDFLVGMSELFLQSAYILKFGELLKLFLDEQVILLVAIEKEIRNSYPRIEDRLDQLEQILRISKFDIQCLKTVANGESEFQALLQFL